ncbi:MAG: hypothetical protein KF754_04700 [Planctomycetes bacterium]|nr:hypothetical protein [Planctomycetota bacterium]
MTEHACPFCGAKLDVAAVPPGKPFRCGGCDVALDAGETRLTPEEARGYRARQRIRVRVFCALAAGLAALAAYLSGSHGDGSAEFGALAAALAAMVVGGVFLLALSRRPAPVPVAPVADKVQG